jgi:tetratricopeptide (TPR) repeat protein
MADSLLSGGRVAQALQLLDQLMKSESGNDLVRLTHKRATFEQLRNRASRAFDVGEMTLAAQRLDSAATLFPAHQWCRDMRRRLDEFAAVLAVDEAPTTTAPKPRALSRELLREVETTYLAAMEQFKAGHLAEAIGQWERVERLAPDFKSVRMYMVNAYKFVGIEEYGKGNLQQAVEIWKKALKLEAANAEIIGYLERTRTEINKLREFSYGDE